MKDTALYEAEIELLRKAERKDEDENERLRAALEKILDGYGPNHGSGFCRRTAAAALGKENLRRRLERSG